MEDEDEAGGVDEDAGLKAAICVVGGAVEVAALLTSMRRVVVDAEKAVGLVSSGLDFEEVDT